MKKVNVVFISDYVCPYCYAAKRALFKAAEEGGYELDVKWYPKEGTPTTEPQVDTVHDPIRNQRYREILDPINQKLNLGMKVPPNVIPRPYSRLALEGCLFAEQFGQADAYSDRVMEAYYLEELDIGDLEVLTRLAGQVGLDEKDFSEALQSRQFSERLDQQEAEAERLYAPTNLPTILLGGIRLDGSSYDDEGFSTLLARAAEDDELTLSSAGCGENGCGF